MSDLRLLLIGDSITDGDTLLLGLRQTHYSGSHLIPINAGAGGDTTAHMLARLDEELALYHPDLVTISAGVNDALQGVSPREHAHCLELMVERCLADGCRVALPTCTPLHLRHAEAAAALAKINANIRALATRRTLPLIDAHGALAPHLETALHEDGVHLSAYGYGLMVRAWLDGLGMSGAVPPTQIMPERYEGLIPRWTLQQIAASRAHQSILGPVPTAGQRELLLPELEPLTDFWREQERARGVAWAYSGTDGEARWLAWAEVGAGLLRVAGTVHAAWLDGERVLVKRRWRGFHYGHLLTVLPHAGRLTLEVGANFAAGVVPA